MQLVDLPLVKSKSIGWNSLYAIRKGELVHDNVKGCLALTPVELIKVKARDKGEGSCLFYDEGMKACSIYRDRPAQCAALKCWDTAEFLEVFRGPKLERRHLIEDRVLLGLIQRHEERCGYDILEELVRHIEDSGEGALDEILDRLQFDYHLRPFLSEKLGVHPDAMDLLLGRPLTRTINMFGLRVIRDKDGSFMLTSTQPPLDPD